ncbi:unnamed protein product [Caenorhabditis angaria]|uniref:Uncharacterized protein n=1 Tax=Caenorhabditis angaria TaxID=860376 RepID=A0A9P1J4V4_9PELO|nr:unnamed protein product [Caenorhabditis angaria]
MESEKDFFEDFPVDDMRFIWEKLEYDDARNLADTCSALRESYFQNRIYIQKPQKFVMRIVHRLYKGRDYVSIMQFLVRNGTTRHADYPDIHCKNMNRIFDTLLSMTRKKELTRILLETNNLEHTFSAFYLWAPGIPCDIISGTLKHRLFFTNATSLELRVKIFTFKVKNMLRCSTLERLKFSLHFRFLEQRYIIPNKDPEILKNLEISVYFDDVINKPGFVPNEKKIELCQTKMGYLSKYFSFSQSGYFVIIKTDDFQNVRLSLDCNISDSFLMDLWC